MQSSSTARLSRIPLAVVVVLAVGLAGGIVALDATENLPGQGGSSSLTAPAPVVLPLSAGEGSVSPRHIEALLGPGAMLETEIKEAPVFGPGEGFIDPAAELGGAIVGGTTSDRADAISDMGEASSDEYVAGPHQVAGGNKGSADDSSSPETEHVVDPQHGRITDY